MDGFDTMTMSYLNPPMTMGGAVSQDSLGMPIMPMDNLDRHSNYDTETYAGSEEQGVYGQRPLSGAPFNNFEEAFSDAVSGYEHSRHPDAGVAEQPEIDGNHKLLSFSVPTVPFTLLDFAYQRSSISMTAQLHGMFFLAESPWALSGDLAAGPTELTCYRRNLFQITGSITVPRTLNFIMTEQGDQIPIVGQELTISATESVEGNPVKIIAVPWKTPAANAPTPDDKMEKEPVSIPLDMATAQDVDSDFVSFPIAWKRLQFRIATANNGRRKELQQNFVVKLRVVATLATGDKVSICEVQSGAIIVRGRSPRNFQSRKDFPIGNGSSAARKQHAHSNRANSGDPVLHRHHTSSSRGNNSVSIPTSNQDTPQIRHDRHLSAPKLTNLPEMQFSYDPTELGITPDFWDWKMPGGQPGAMTALPQDTSFSIPGAESAQYAKSSPDLARHPEHGRRTASKGLVAAPITLSLTDEGPRRSASPRGTAGGAHKAPRLSHTQPTQPRTKSFSLNPMGSLDDSADLLYEYFPLGLDDWQEPVDAVYRPHVVHHMNVPEDPKVLAVKNKSKRYFSSDEPS